MGFGTGFDEPPLRGAVVRSILALVATVSHVVISEEATPNVLVVTPEGTPDSIDLRAIAADPTQRVQHARKLVSARSHDDAIDRFALRTQRTVLGDARDLLVSVLRAWTATDGASRINFMQRNDPSDGAPLDESGFPCVIHVGPTRSAMNRLQALQRESQSALDPTRRMPWDGRLESLDGDGFLYLCVNASTLTATSKQLILLGGSEYGTHNAVTSFLRRYTNVDWLFPGRLGEVITPPADKALRTDRTFDGSFANPPNLFDSPALRSRTFAAMSSGGAVHTAVEKDEMRTWLLRNQVRPSTLRAEILEGFPDLTPVTPPTFTDPPCALPSDQAPIAFYWAIRETEERTPSGHNLARHLSPLTPGLNPSRNSLSPALLPELATNRDPAWFRVHPDQMLNIYPDVRPRLTVGTPTTISAGASVPAVYGAFPPRFTSFLVVPEPCEGAFPCTCPVHLPPNSGDRVATTLVVPPKPIAGTTVPGAVRDEDFLPNSAYREPLSAAVKGQFASFVLRGDDWHFIPVVRRDTRYGVMYPDAVAWNPCIFEVDRLRPKGTPFPVHPKLIIDLAAQVQIAMLGRSMRQGGDRAHSLSFEDAAPWCQCDACVRADASAGDNDLVLLYWQTILTDQRTLFDVQSDFLASHENGRALLATELRRGIPGSMSSPYLSWVDGNPVAVRSMTLNELCMRGFVHDRGAPGKHTRRVLALTNAVAEAAAFGEAPPVAWVKRTVLSVLAYGDYVSAPLLTSGRPGDRVLRPGDAERAEAVLPGVMVWITEARDTAEYGDSVPYPDVTPGDHSPAGVLPGALARMQQWPQQFQHERWALIAPRTGFYEYLYGGRFVAPRIYTSKLRNAVRQGLRRFNLRGFVSETWAAWGLQGPMLWELAQVLWNPEPEVSTLRARFCARAFGAASELMQQFFDGCEQAWSLTRDADRQRPGEAPARPDRRTSFDVADGYYGQGFAGRWVRLSQLWGLYQVPPGSGRQSFLESLWSLLGQALETLRGREGSPEWQRVQLYRRSFGFVVMIARWYKPLHNAFEAIRRANRASNALSSGRAKIEGMANVDGLLASEHATADVPLVGFSDVRSAMGLTDQVHAVRACIGTPDQPGIRLLRRRIHQYLTQQNLSLNLVLNRDGIETVLASGGDLGFGLFSGTASSTLADPPFGASVADNDHRHVGLFWPEIAGYATWWASTFRYNDPVTHTITRDVISDQEHNTNIALGDDRGSLGWIVQEAKAMAKVVLLYCDGVSNSGDYRLDRAYAAIRGG